MLFVIQAIDKTPGSEARTNTRPAHLQYLADAGDRIKLAGPMLAGEGAGDDQGVPIGSLIIIDAASEAAVKLFADNDPYTSAGVFKEVTIRPFKGVTGAYLADD